MLLCNGFNVLDPENLGGIMTKRIVRISVLCLTGLLLVLGGQGLAAPKKIFLVFSYHPGLFWHVNAEKGLRDALKGIPCEYRSFYMDTKHHQDATWIYHISQEAIRRIKDYQPDVLVGFDDNAAQYVLAHFLGTPLPLVFLGVNREPEEYGFVKGSRKHPGLNVTGVLERHYFLQSIQLFSSLLGKPVKRIGLLSDSSATSHTMISNFMKIAKRHQLPVVFFKFAYSFSGWEKIIREAQGKTDLLVIYNCEGLKGKGDRDINSDDVIAWTIAHNRVPEISFFSRYIKKGFAGGIFLTGYYQGFYAGKKVAEILRGVSPGNIPIDVPPKGTVAFNMGRIRELGLKIPLGVLHSAVLFGK
ncbi:MAG: hypothetical protein DSY91_02595 [Deltaproteobacteria bacterium]|nr:MAG: hypothetical protein DSY91_02595 [Deltaproteobacteria bacterium]